MAQDFIELDGRKIPIKDLDQKFGYNALGYEVNLTKSEIKPSLNSTGSQKKLKVTDQRVFASYQIKSFALATVYGHVDSARYYLPFTDLKFFDENGNLKWEKKLDGATPRSCYLTSDGKYSIYDFKNCKTSDEGDLKNFLTIFDEKGNTICEYLSPVKFSISRSRDMVCYQEDVSSTHNLKNNKTFYCVDLKTGKQWSKSFEKEVSLDPASSNGDYILAYSDSTYTIYYRDGSEISINPLKEFGGGIWEISDDGKYALVVNAPPRDISYFNVIEIKSMKVFRTNYLNVEKNKVRPLYNSGTFVEKSKYIVALTSIIAPYKALIIFHDFKGKYLGHHVYHDIQSSFWSPRISLQKNGSFEVFVDGRYLGNLVLPNKVTLDYLKE
jgi:hypothetical protein